MTEEEVKRKLTAILSPDVKGYSRLMSQDGLGTIRILTADKEAMSTLIETYPGRVADAPGDNLLAEFTSMVDAVSRAVETLREPAERSTDLPSSRRMEFPIGINLGRHDFSIKFQNGNRCIFLRRLKRHHRTRGRRTSAVSS